MNRMRRLFVGFVLAISACTSAPGEPVKGVSLKIVRAAAIYGGCGDAGPAVIPEAGVRKCGPDRDFSMTVSMLNETSSGRRVSVDQVEVISASTSKQVASTAIGGASAGGKAFDGMLPAGQELEVRYEINTYSFGYSYYQAGPGQLLYQATFRVEGETTVLSSPAFDYSGPPK